MGKTEFAKKPFPRLAVPLVALLLVLVTLYVHYPVGQSEFLHFDDDMYVTSNPYVQGGLSLRTFLWSWTSVNVGNWHPLTMLSLALDRTLFGSGLEPPWAGSAAAFHFTNLFFHLAATVLLFLVLRRMTGCLWPSAWVAALFALHPLHVESVAWVAERKDVLSGFFWMVTLWTYVRYTEMPSWRRYVWVLLAFVLGLLSKPMLVTLPCVLLLLDYWPLRRLPNSSAKQPGSSGETTTRPATVSGWWPLVREKLPLFALAGLSSLMALQSQYPLMPLEERPLSLRLENAVVAYAVYMRKMVWPVDLAAFYPLSSSGWPVWEAAALAGLLLAITALAWWERSRRPYLIVGWLWYLGTLVPVIGLVQVGWQAWADRYTYLPLIGIFIMVAWGVRDLLRGWAHGWNVLVGLGTASVILCALLTRAQIYYWHDDFQLWKHTLEVTSDNDFAHDSMGVFLAAQHKRKEATREYQIAVAINPRNDHAQTNLAKSYLAESNGKDKAIAALRAALEVNPRNAEAHSLLGQLYLPTKPQEGMDHLREAIRLDPREAKRHDLLADILEERGNLDEAAAHLEEAVRLAPDAPFFHHHLGVVLCRLGRWDEADAHLRQALELAIAFNKKELLEPIRQQLRLCHRHLTPNSRPLTPGSESPDPDS
jgi:Flp pilus assembly protein TadD